MATRRFLPPYIQRGIIALAVFLLVIAAARMHVRVHQQGERIEQLEEMVEAMNARIDRIVDDSQSAPDATNYHRPYSYPSYQRMATDNSYMAQGHRQSESHASPAAVTSAADSLSEPLADFPPSASEQAKSPRGKFTEARLFNLNHIDSATLVRIPGIAARTASTILKNREKYGGFYDPWQLQDFLTWDAAQSYMHEWCTQWFTASVADVKHIRLNQASIAELRNHPYINYDQALEIVRYRTRHKRIEKVEEFENFSTFTPADVKRLAIYLSFE